MDQATLKEEMNLPTRGDKPESGFTMVELMIIVMVIGLLAAVTAPKLALLIEKARETRTKGALVAIKSAVSMYYSAFEGIYPEQIETSESHLFSRFLESLPPVKATHTGIGAGTVEGPYGASVLYTTSEAITETGRGWRYNRLNGRVFVNSAATDSKGVAYSAYGY